MGRSPVWENLLEDIMLKKPKIENWVIHSTKINWVSCKYQVFGWEGALYGLRIENKEKRKNMLVLNHLSLVNLLFPNNYSFFS